MDVWNKYLTYNDRRLNAAFNPRLSSKLYRNLLMNY